MRVRAGHWDRSYPPHDGEPLGLPSVELVRGRINGKQRGVALHGYAGAERVEGGQGDSVRAGEPVHVPGKAAADGNGAACPEEQAETERRETPVLVP